MLPVLRRARADVRGAIAGRGRSNGGLAERFTRRSRRTVRDRQVAERLPARASTILSRWLASRIISIASAGSSRSTSRWEWGLL
jgi:hypothetical protein